MNLRFLNRSRNVFDITFIVFIVFIAFITFGVGSVYQALGIV